MDNLQIFQEPGIAFALILEQAITKLESQFDNGMTLQIQLRDNSLALCENLISCLSGDFSTPRLRLSPCYAAIRHLQILRGKLIGITIATKIAVWDDETLNNKCATILRMDEFMPETCNQAQRFSEYSQSMHAKFTPLLENETKEISLNAIIFALNLLDEYLKTVKNSLLKDIAKDNTFAENKQKNCPQCGRPMRLLMAKTGKNAGGKFWGCTGYPECKYCENHSTDEQDNT